MLEFFLRPAFYDLTIVLNLICDISLLLIKLDFEKKNWNMEQGDRSQYSD
jgi:hypothetical protein